jgi:hypothetical protein
VSYTAQVQAQLTSSTGFGVPIVFDLYLDGFWIASRQMVTTRAIRAGRLL